MYHLSKAAVYWLVVPACEWPRLNSATRELQTVPPTLTNNSPCSTVCPYYNFISSAIFTCYAALRRAEIDFLGIEPSRVNLRRARTGICKRSVFLVDAWSSFLCSTLHAFAGLFDRSSLVWPLQTTPWTPPGCVRGSRRPSSPTPRLARPQSLSSSKYVSREYLVGWVFQLIVLQAEESPGFLDALLNVLDQEQDQAVRLSGKNSSRE